MLKTRSAAYVQLAGFIIALGLLFVLARFFPIVDLIGAAQQRMMHWGVWGGLCYPFLFALCNILLLPGGILCVGGGFFFGLWWGFTIVFVGKRDRGGDFIRVKPMAGGALVSATVCAKPDLARVGTRRRAGGLEDYCS